MEKQGPKFQYDKNLVSPDVEKEIGFNELNLGEVESKIEEVKKSLEELWNGSLSSSLKKEVEVQTTLTDDEAIERLSPNERKYFKSLIEKRDQLKKKLQEIESKQISLN